MQNVDNLDSLTFNSFATRVFSAESSCAVSLPYRFVILENETFIVWFLKKKMKKKRKTYLSSLCHPQIKFRLQFTSFIFKFSVLSFARKFSFEFRLFEFFNALNLFFSFFFFKKKKSKGEPRKQIKSNYTIE